MAHTFKPINWEAKPGRSLGVQDHPGLHSEFRKARIKNRETLSQKAEFNGGRKGYKNGTLKFIYLVFH